MVSWKYLQSIYFSLKNIHLKNMHHEMHVHNYIFDIVEQVSIIRKEDSYTKKNL